MRFRERLMQFMQGRYGADALNRALVVVSFVFMILSWFVFHTAFYLVGLVIILYCAFRMFSRNIQARYKENVWYMKQVNKVKYFFSKLKYRKEAGKTHHIYSCPKCKQKIRVPKGKGKIMVRCPKCGTEFMKRS